MSANPIDPPPPAAAPPVPATDRRRARRRRQALTGAVLAAASVATIALLYVRAAPDADAGAVPPAPATVAAPGTGQPGPFTGFGFDACTAPPSATMRAWLASPYRAVGIYFGGAARGCTQANLTAQWVAEQRAAGWRLVPLYVGPQATCTLATKKKQRIDNPHAAAQGRLTAEDAVRAAKALGLAPASTLIYDMEAYRTDDPACHDGVLGFLSAWTSRLHDFGYLSGIYSSVSSGVAHQVAAYTQPGYVRPDYVNFARWDKAATVTDAVLPAGYWTKRRLKQYQGDHLETWGGVTLNIDSSYLDVAAPPAPGLGDVDRNGWSDVVARHGGSLLLYPGDGTAVETGSARTLATGFAAMNAAVRIGDLNRDGFTDVVARQSTGVLWAYPGTATGLGPRRKLAANVKALREITAIGDLNRDGYPDLIAGQGKNLYLYPGRSGTRLAPRKLIAAGGWDAMSELAGVGDLDRDGYPDLVARYTRTGALFVYPGRRTGFAARKLLGTGWTGMRDLVGIGDFDRDGHPDLAAVQKSTGWLFRYPSNGTALTGRVRLATGFGAAAPVL